jgi:hypothetical protein
VNDCTHPVIKCHKCHRYLEGDPDETANPSTSPTLKPIDPNGYYPAKIDPYPYGINIAKGPFTITIAWTAEGVKITVWDNTYPDTEPLTTCQADFEECVSPRLPALIDNPDQREITYGLT